MTIDEMIEILEAAKQGKTIERKTGSNWQEVEGFHLNFYSFTYRIKPQKTKRLLTPMELFERGATHIKNTQNDIYTIISFQNKKVETDSKSYNLLDVSIDSYKSYYWTSDRETWHSFEVEE